MAHLLARGLVALALAAALATSAHSEGIEEAHGVDVADACHDDGASGRGAGASPDAWWRRCRR
jgi:hypothetical protein